MVLLVDLLTTPCTLEVLRAWVMAFLALMTSALCLIIRAIA